MENLLLVYPGNQCSHMYILLIYTIVCYSKCVLQVIYNANELAKLKKKKKQMQNWLDFYQLKYDRDPSNRPTRKVITAVRTSVSVFVI